MIYKVKVKWRVAIWCPILRICALHLTHPLHTHSSEHTRMHARTHAHTHTHTHTHLHTHTHHEHTPWTHTLSSGQPMLWRPGSSRGFSALLKGLTSVVVLKVEESASYSLPPTDNSCRKLKLEPMTFEQWLSVTKWNIFVTVLKYSFQVSVLYWSSFILSNFYFYFTTFQSIRSHFLLHYIS